MKEDMIKSDLVLSADGLIGLLVEAQETTLAIIRDSTDSVESIRLKVLGSRSDLAFLTKKLSLVAKEDRPRLGILVNQIKLAIEEALAKKSRRLPPETAWRDVTEPGIQPPIGHLHIVSQAISEITRIFEHIGFTRVRHPEVDWDWYTFESLNMPPNHPARDEWETFFIEKPSPHSPDRKAIPIPDRKNQKIVLTPHTSNGQVREMEKGILPIRMINIAKCYRKQSDISHSPMFHQFEGLYVDKNVSIGTLKGVCDYFFKLFYGPDRKSRLRPFHFQFTEPSFEIDVTCGVCNGSGKLNSGDKCKLCKEGWLELGGAGMVHPTVLKNGGVDTDIYSGFAFGWGIERTYMMKSGTQLDDVRLLYGNDLRFLEQF